MYNKSKARIFFNKFWLDNGTTLSKSVTTILEFIVDGKLTLKGRIAYKKLIINLDKKPFF